MKQFRYYEHVTITDFAAEGKCIYRSEDGVIFIEGNAAPGDVVDLEVFKQSKKFQEARIIKFHEYSPLRVSPYCKHAEECGGCRWQHIEYSTQLKLKRQQVQDHIRRIGAIQNIEVEDTLPAINTRFYRNKLEFTFSNYGWFSKEVLLAHETLNRNVLGFHVPKRFDRVFPVHECHLQPNPSNVIRNRLAKFASQNGISFYNLRANRGVLRNVIIRTSRLGEVLVIVQFGENDSAAIETVMNFLAHEISEISSLHYIVNQKGNDSYQDQQVIHYSGSTTIKERLGELTFLVSPKSFFQTNTEQATNLYDIVREMSGLTGEEIVYDLYSGTGTIANYIADLARKVIGVEYIEDAVFDARINSEQNGIKNTEFVAGDMAKALTLDFLAKHGSPHLVILDPPRVGIESSIANFLLSAKPRRIIYVSCNSATLARDLSLLTEAYEIIRIKPVDMFPNTHHVECIALLTLL